MKIWTLEEAVALVRELEPHLAECGWHMALGGGVVMRGQSAHDVDLICYPHDASKPRDYRSRTETLKALGLRRTHDYRAVQQIWRGKGSTDTKHVEVWVTPDGSRVDVISP